MSDMFAKVLQKSTFNKDGLFIQLLKKKLLDKLAVHRSLLK